MVAVPDYGPRAVMNLDSILEQVGKIDLDGRQARLEGQPALADELAADRAQVAALAAQFAGDARYAPLLEWLLDITLRRPVWLPQFGDGGVNYAAWREGGNAVVWQLLQAIAEGRAEPPPPREGV